MEQILQEKMKQTTKQYDVYINETHADIDRADNEIEDLEKILEKERIKTDTL